MANEWPRRVRVGSGVVSVYRTEYGGKRRFRIVWHEAGERRMRGATSLRRAMEIAREQARAINSGYAGLTVLDRTEADEWIEARRIAQAGGRSVLGALREWRALTSRSGIHPRRRATVDELATELAEARREDHCTEAYARRLERELSGLGEDFDGREIDTIATDELEDWLRSRKVGPRRRRNLRATLVTLWRWAQRRGALPDGQTAAERLESIRVKIAKVHIYTPDEMKQLLKAASREMIPWLSICGFVGVRSEGEIGRLKRSIFV